MSRANLMIVGLCLGVLGAGAGVYALVFRDDAPAVEVPRAEPAPAPATRQPARTGREAFELVDVSGVVEVRRGGAWVKAASGDRLLETEAIRTGPDGRALIRSGGDELTLRERVELEVTMLSGAVTELALTRGKVRAAPASATERFEITSAGARAVAPGGSRFTVYADTRGAVAVASEAGDVKVIAEGHTVTVATQTQTYVAPGAPPQDPIPISDEVFLAITWPAAEIHAPRTVLRGQTAPGTIISVNGEPAVVDDQGRFETQLPLREGKNPVNVVAEAVGGSVKREGQQILVTTTGPPLEVDPSRMYDPPPARDGGPARP